MICFGFGLIGLCNDIRGWNVFIVCWKRYCRIFLLYMYVIIKICRVLKIRVDEFIVFLSKYCFVRFRKVKLWIKWGE